MLPIDKFPVLQKALTVATGNTTRRVYYVRDVLLSKPKTATDKRYKAFNDLVLGWIKQNIEIGTATEQGICLVTHFHEESLTNNPQNHITQTQVNEINLNVALDYFESLMGNTFRLI